MSTVAQMKNLAAPLLARHPDLAIVGRSIIVRPITHVACGIMLENSSGKVAFTPLAGATYLFGEKAFLFFNWNCHFPATKPGIWELGHPDHQSVFIEQAEVLLPKLRAINSLEAFLAFTESPEIDYSWTAPTMTRLLIQAALGDLPDARKTYDILRSFKTRPPGQEGAFFAKLLAGFGPALEEGDRQTIARLLHQWERATVEACKLAPYWQPTPFPIEQTG
ncbi:hypothetical protein GCM10007301_35670 [Azorhizobium oxalatiphilum]|uniref:DUF4304 domain-containing protein n=1 Tax=Azorhizobium oxalatiphilum TaxID=980631 RepID=A0A917C576_9HYPH|nr:hypothetical protein [Azorhizobium oxalatiphilum]GGF72720.1 hypothetical protein GCM10007301_35670 [Azorhizobium oxalatiphilum]